jgi:hypothetical protein
MDGFMRARRVIAFAVPKEVNARHMDVVGRGDVASPAATVNDIRTRRGQETFRSLDPLHGLNARGRLCVIVLGQALDLLDVKNGVALHEGNGALGFLAGRAVRIASDDLVGIDDKAAVLALADIGF